MLSLSTHNIPDIPSPFISLRSFSTFWFCKGSLLQAPFPVAFFHLPLQGRLYYCSLVVTPNSTADSLATKLPILSPLFFSKMWGSPPADPFLPLLLPLLSATVSFFGFLFPMHPVDPLVSIFPP